MCQTTFSHGDTVVLLPQFTTKGYIAAAAKHRVAFLTSVMSDQSTGRKIGSIFIPYTPYLTTGYLQLVPLEWVTETNWTVEEAVKWVMSGGIIHPESMLFDQAPPVRWEEPRAPADAGRRARPADAGT